MSEFVRSGVLMYYDLSIAYRQYFFYCPGCREDHCVGVRMDGSGWSFDGDHERPTFTPSVKVTGVRPITDDEADRLSRGEHVEPEPRCCHSYVTAGRIEFLSDCTHELAGRTVDMVPGPHWFSPPTDTEGA